MGEQEAHRLEATAQARELRDKAALITTLQGGAGGGGGAPGGAGGGGGGFGVGVGDGEREECDGAAGRWRGGGECMVHGAWGTGQGSSEQPRSAQ